MERKKESVDRKSGAGGEKLPVVAVVLAAGKGRRMGTAVPKQFAEAEGRPVLAYTVEKFQEHPEVDGIIVICGRGSRKIVTEICKKSNFSKVKRVAAGGRTRRESSYKGVKAAEKLYGDCVVLIHDAARPNVTGSVISDNIRLAKKFGACVTAARAVDTVVTSVDGQLISGLIPRDTVWTVQTPQSFRLGVILNAHELYEQSIAAGENVPDITDDGSLVRFAGGEVAICESGRDNFKLTVPADLELFRAMLKRGKT